jgi:hypothetical protein
MTAVSLGVATLRNRRKWTQGGSFATGHSISSARASTGTKMYNAVTKNRA